MTLAFILSSALLTAVVLANIPDEQPPTWAEAFAQAAIYP